MVCSLHHSWQTSVSQTFSLSVICSSDTERKVDILEKGLDMFLGPLTANIIIIISVLIKLLSGLRCGRYNACT